MEDRPHVRVGVGVFVIDPAQSTAEDTCFLIGKRKGSHGAGTFALPGGHLEFGETLEECAAREVLEETGLRVKDVRFMTATNDHMLSEHKHYVTLFMTCVRVDDTQLPRNLEPHKCEGWEWIRWRELVKWVNEDVAVGADGTRRAVFMPLIDLIQQRPGLVPSA